MAIITRVNPKTNIIEYRYRYLWVDENGKRRDSKTGWFPTIQEAEEDALRKKAQKEEDSNAKTLEKYYQKVETVYFTWMNELEALSERETTENTTTDKTNFNRARTVYKKYFPANIKSMKIHDLNETTFRGWLNTINSNQKLSGQSVRNYKGVLIKFNQYLGNKGYYRDPDLDRRIDTSLARVQLKPKSYLQRKDRRCPTLEDINVLVKYYEGEGLGEFYNFYWYTLWYVLFFSGLRVSELIGLQWKFVDLKHDTMDIRNSISERELKRNVDKRVSQEIYHTKNINSERIIPIFASYSQLLSDYRKAFKYHFDLEEKDLRNCYVFPLVLKTKEDPNDYQKQKNILRELDKVCVLLGLEKTDVQMIRHGCATWMVTDREDGGLGFNESQAKDYFGHTGDDMLREIYAKLNKKQRAKKTKTTFSPLLIPKPEEETNTNSFLRELTEKVLDQSKNQESIDNARYKRIKSEIAYVIAKKQETYEFFDEDSWAIGGIITEYKELGIDLTELIDLVWIHNKERIVLKKS